MKLAEQAVQQEARRVLRKLMAPRQGLFVKGAHFVLGRNAQSRNRVAPDMVAEFARRDWIVPDGAGRYLLGEGGRAFLVRQAGVDGKAGFADQHRLMQDSVLAGNNGPDKVRVNLGESPLARLRARGLVNEAQFAAGEKLRRDFTLAQLTPRMGVDLSAPVVSGARGAGGDSISDIAMTARKRLNQALSATGPGLSGLVFDVCCHLIVLEQCEDARRWARRSGRVVLMLALDRLAAHYGIGVTRHTSPIRAWCGEAG